jgi:hypothetical protein
MSNLEPVFRMLATLTPEERRAIRRKLLDEETQSEAKARIEKSIENLERGEGIVFTMAELEKRMLDIELRRNLVKVDPKTLKRVDLILPPVLPQAHGGEKFFQHRRCFGFQNPADDFRPMVEFIGFQQVQHRSRRTQFGVVTAKDHAPDLCE